MPPLGPRPPSRPLEPSTLVTLHATAPPVGLLEVTTLPFTSTATQRLLLGQDGPGRELKPSTLVTFQPAAPAGRLLDATTLPPSPTARQRPPVRQTTRSSS